jgi:periplasmic protein TonB
MKLKSFLFIAVILISMNAMATPKDSAYTYRFSVENHYGHSYLNFQLDSSWYFMKENFREHFVYNEFVNPSLKEELNIIQLAADFSLVEAGKTKIPSKILTLNFKEVTKQYKSADYEQKMGYVQLDIPHKKAILNLKMLGIGKGFLLVYELHDRSTWMMWYPALTEAKKELLKSREGNADKMILESFVPTDKKDPSKEEMNEDSSFVDAEFQGGFEELSKFVNENLEIPVSFMESANFENGSSSCRVNMRFVIGKDGSINDFYVDNMNDVFMPSLVNVSIKLYRKMPNWTPASEQGKPISIFLRLPLKFEVF